MTEEALKVDRLRMALTRVLGDTYFIDCSSGERARHMFALPMTDGVKQAMAVLKETEHE